MALSKKQKKQKIKDFKEGSLVEGAKNAILIRGNKTNEVINNVFNEFKLLSSCKYLNHRRYLYPFDDTKAVEDLCIKQLSSLFILGHHTKKRPNNLIFGRLYNEQILDMYEVGVISYEPLQKGVLAARYSRPLLLFQGDAWETDPIQKHFKSLMLDIFGGPAVKSVDILGITRAVVFTIHDDLLITQYEIQHVPNLCKNIREIGPRINLQFRRNQIQLDVFKQALKMPKVNKKIKNVEADKTLGKRGRIWVQQDSIDTLALRKRKGLKSKRRELSDKSRVSQNGERSKSENSKKEFKKEKQLNKYKEDKKDGKAQKKQKIEKKEKRNKSQDK